MMKLVHLLLMLTLYCNVATAALDRVRLCRQQKEIVFLLDASRSIGPTNFQKVRDFVKELVGRFDVGPNATRIGVVTFSNSYRSDIHLDAHNSKDEIQQAIQRIGYTDGMATNTHVAIEHARERVFSQDHGNYSQIIVCVTDGMPTDRHSLAREVNKTREAGITMLAIGVGDNVREGLEQLASENSSDFIYHVDSFSSLPSVVERLSLKACYAAPPGECPLRPTELAFVLDQSTSVGQENFTKVINFTKNIVNLMDVGPNDTQVAVVTYASVAHEAMLLNSHSTKEEVLAGLQNIRYRSGGDTRTDVALQRVQQSVFQARNGDRGDRSSHVVVVVTDGRSQYRVNTRDEAEEMKKNGVVIFAIGAGDFLEGELEEIATKSNSSEKYYFEVNDLEALTSIRNIMLNMICSE